MAAVEPESTFTLDELTISTLATADALAKLLIKRGLLRRTILYCSFTGTELNTGEC